MENTEENYYYPEFISVKEGKKLNEQLDALQFNRPRYLVPFEEVEFENRMGSLVMDEKQEEVEEETEPKDQIEVFSVINTRALASDAPTYELEKFEKKALIIFNQEVFDRHDPRPGTEKDVESLTYTFERFGFDVFPHHDLGKDDIFKELEKFSSQDFTNYGCVAVAVLTHGSEAGLRARDRQFKEIEIINYFKDCNKPTLVTKPKIFIIQACRGSKISKSVPVNERYAVIGKDADETIEPYHLPEESDMLVLHSSYAGKSSIRDVTNGTWFIQELCEKINVLSPELDLESIVVEVKRAVAVDRQYTDRITRDINKQMPVTTSTLIRKLYLKKFGDESNEVTFSDRWKRVPSSIKYTVGVRELPSNSAAELTQNAVATLTPNALSPRLGSCPCVLDHFEYLRKCLVHFTIDNPEDETAQDYLALADELEAGTEELIAAKEKLGKMISKHLQKVTRGDHCYRYLYFYKH